jgi:LysM repeat protein
MASNAKIGLLLGLVVIFVIAFLLNGLHSFVNVGGSDDLSKIVIIDKPDILPEDFPPGRVPERHPEETPHPEDKGNFRGQPPGTTSPDEADNYTEPVKQAWPKVHIVCKGDNLADIAKKFYGFTEGNRRANIKRIFEANSKAIESPDRIYPGQKLIIPPLWASNPDKNSVESIFPDSLFEEVDSIGRRHL